MQQTKQTPLVVSRKKWRDAAISLIVFFILAIIVIVIFGVVFGKEASMGKKVGGAFKGAVDNDAKCNNPGVICTFQPTGAPPPLIAPNPNTYSPAEAAFAAQIIAVLEAALQNNVEPVQLDGTLKLALLSTPKNKNICWVLQSPGAVWVAYRGTETLDEWKQDFDLKQTQWGGDTGMLVHSGFNGVYLDLKDDLAAVLKQHVTNETVLYVCGHSLGAALALLCTSDLQQNPTATSDVRTYVFAPPRTGNPAFVNTTVAHSNGAIHALANHADIVPDLPLPVEPNFQHYNSPWFYQQFPLLTFDVNWGSWILNHTLPVYIAHLDSVSYTQPVIAIPTSHHGS
jgi:hypothetical protein